MPQKKKILLLSKYPRIGASSRLRSLQYLPFLEANGFDVTLSSLFDDEYLSRLYGQGERSALKIAWLYLRRLTVLFGVFRYDLIWIEYEIFPYLPAFAERLLRLLGRKYVADYDDAIFHNYDLSGSPLIRGLLCHKIDAVMRNSWYVTAGNNYLMERAREAGAARIAFVPTVVDRQRYPVRAGLATDGPVIGWIGSPSTQKYVVGIRDALGRACQLHGARLMLVGASSQVIDELRGINVEVVPWSEASEADLICRMDIGIMPLLDGPWEKGKCGYKLIQYMACAVPVIASPIGVNIELVSSSHSGLFADTAAEWENALFQLLESPERRRQLGEAGRQAVEKTFSLQVQAPVLSRIFNEVINHNRD